MGTIDHDPIPDHEPWPVNGPEPVSHLWGPWIPLSTLSHYRQCVHPKCRAVQTRTQRGEDVKIETKGEKPRG